MSLKRQTDWVSLLEKATGKLFSCAALGIGKLKQEPQFQFFGRLSPDSLASSVTERSLFDLSSLTKVFLTTSVVARLVDRNEIQLNDRLQDWWPELSWAEARKSICVQDVLCHMADFPAWRDFSHMSRIEILNAIVEEPLVAQKGKQTIYSDLGFILLAALLEHKTETEWRTLCEENVVKPLGLDFMIPSPVCAKDFPEGIASTMTDEGKEREWVYPNDANARTLGGVSGHAGYFADVRSSFQITQSWMEALNGNEHFLSQKIAEQFLTPQDCERGNGRALGWDVPTRPDSTGGQNISKRAVGHLGFTGTSVWMDLDRKAWVVLLTNRTSMDTPRKAMNEFRMKLHDAIWKWVDR